jgi:hypothetical protein
MITETQFQPWTEEELTRLKELAGTMTARQIGEKIGRGYHGISKQLRKLGLQTWKPPVKEVPVRLPKPVKAKVENKAPEPKPKPVAKPAQAPVALRKKEVKRPLIHGEVEWCPECFAPVSNWNEHYQRLGHRRPAA